MSFSSSISLSSLNGTNGFRLVGVAAQDGNGASVASAGDVNGDGFDDLIIGAPGADPNGRTDAGATYIVFGRSGGWVSGINLSSLNGNTGFRLDGVSAQDLSGASVSSAGDVNGDGFDDLIVGAQSADTYGTDSGASYVVFGRQSGWASAFALSGLNGSNGFRLDGAAASGNSGLSVASAGDVNGDGYADLIVGAPQANFGKGDTFVVFGKSSGFAASMNLSALDGDNGFRLVGASLDGQSGYSVASAGDVNGDGYADLIIGAPVSDRNKTDSGSSYVVFGKPSGFPYSMNLSTLDGSNGFRLDGGGANDQSGYSVASAGDVNGDGFADIIVGAPYSNVFGFTEGWRYGNSYVVFGRSAGFAASLNIAALNGNDGFRLEGEGTVRQAGFSVASAGDVNGDGFADVIVGTPGSFLGIGGAYVVLGRSGGFFPIMQLSKLIEGVYGGGGFVLWGTDSSQYTGSSVASAGDVDGDGFADLILGSPGSGYSGREPGYSSFFFSPATGGATYRGTSLADTLRGTPDNDVMNGYGQNDRLFGNAGDDTLNGGLGNDVVDGGAGNDTAQLSGTRAAYRFGIRDGVLITSGADGLDQFVNVEDVQWGNAVKVSLAVLQSDPSNAGLGFAKLGDAPAGYILPDAYSGPAEGLVNVLRGGGGNDIILGTGKADVLNGGVKGDDALDGGAGNDEIDGGLGSNFLTGGAGRDVFFVDGRGAATANTWSTITDYAQGEQVTIWGYRPGVSKFVWVANDGVGAYKGATQHWDLDGNGLIDTSVTFTGLTQAQLPTPTFGTVSGQDYILFG